MACGVCFVEDTVLIPHPCFSDGPLSELEACPICCRRLVGDWPLGDDGKHQWCRVCGMEAATLDDLKDTMRLTKREARKLTENGQMDEHGAALYTCDDDACPEAICAVCMLRLYTLTAVLEAQDANRWECGVCTARELAYAHPASE
jgi:hypothetical protein